MASIDLALPRVLTISDRGTTYTLTLARITKKQWMRYFEGIQSTSENQAGKRVDFFDSTSARVDLVESALMAAAGYATADGSAADSKPGWQKQIPLAHRVAAGNVLVEVGRADVAEDGPIMLGVEAVFLSSVWSADSNGVMQKYSGLAHRFKAPTAEHQRRYSRDSNRSMVIGGSRRGVTRWLGVQATLVDLYDDLITGVDGYTWEGKELGSDRDAIVAEMDTYHKVAAADLLFTPASVNEAAAVEVK